MFILIGFYVRGENRKYFPYITLSFLTKNMCNQLVEGRPVQVGDCDFETWMDIWKEAESGDNSDDDDESDIEEEPELDNTGAKGGKRSKGDVYYRVTL